MRVVARVERQDGFARVYYKNGEAVSICLSCSATVVPRGFQTLEDAERLHYEVCSKILVH
jgi:hypothetical protein